MKNNLSKNYASMKIIAYNEHNLKTVAPSSTQKKKKLTSRSQPAKLFSSKISLFFLKMNASKDLTPWICKIYKIYTPSLLLFSLLGLLGCFYGWRGVNRYITKSRTRFLLKGMLFSFSSSFSFLLNATSFRSVMKYQ